MNVIKKTIATTLHFVLTFLAHTNATALSEKPVMAELFATVSCFLYTAAVD